jgi:hypothetical protein
MAVTANYGFTKPTVAGDAGVWGGFLNTDLDSIDLVLAVPKINWTSPTVGATTTCDLSISRVFAFTVSQATTLAFSNPPTAAFDAKVALLITNGSAFVLTFPASVTWLAGVAPTLKAAGVDIVDLETKDAGVTWFATLRNPRPGTLYQNVSKTTTSGSDVSLDSFVLPAGTLGISGQALRITVAGSIVTGSATINLKFGTGTMTSFVTAANDVFVVTILLTRAGATAQRVNVSVVKAGGTTATSTVAGLTETLANAITIDFRGNATTGGQTLTYDSIQVELLARA